MRGVRGVCEGCEGVCERVCEGSEGCVRGV